MVVVALMGMHRKRQNRSTRALSSRVNQSQARGLLAAVERSQERHAASVGERKRPAADDRPAKRSEWQGSALEEALRRISGLEPGAGE